MQKKIKNGSACPLDRIQEKASITIKLQKGGAEPMLLTKSLFKRHGFINENVHFAAPAFPNGPCKLKNYFRISQL